MLPYQSQRTGGCSQPLRLTFAARITFFIDTLDIKAYIKDPRIDIYLSIEGTTTKSGMQGQQIINLTRYPLFYGYLQESSGLGTS